jgi:hypothetical protein
MLTDFNTLGELGHKMIEELDRPDTAKATSNK